ncbi:hypothetical protein AK812_SmicGene36704 [Symbiodinium microadriaticum]|uniref:Uncharacterized protein n=1 Tax=Symbiodinium microadriaticum TaxID=2951 RepID=A0A1Q9CIF1_SYMMI|nr:hypothetical protein AK812_SmicGene36704 [Symbiodinium microadriaticum]
MQLRTRKKQRLSIDGFVDEAGPGDYRLCWCQGSRRPCSTPEDFNFDVGKLNIASAQYVWPLCTFEETVFRSWRDWQTFDDCCCNYDEAGAVGCKDEASYTYQLCSASLSAPMTLTGRGEARSPQRK